MYDARREKATVGQQVDGGWELVVVVVARQSPGSSASPP